MALGTFTITGNTSTSYIITAIDTTLGCSASIDTVTLNVSPAPPIPTISVNGNTYTCNESGYSYLWFKNGIPISASLYQQSYTATQLGQYTVQITDAHGCTSMSLPLSIAIDIPLLTHFTLAPNPCHNTMYLTWESNAAQDITITIYDLSGKQIELISIKKLNEGEIYPIDIAKLPQGFYFLQIESQGRIANHKIIKEA